MQQKIDIMTGLVISVLMNRDSTITLVQLKKYALYMEDIAYANSRLWSLALV